jgi:NAD(P)-dependent dehydrogenase (short-subunit alcohol dehydrogenase family)
MGVVLITGCSTGIGLEAALQFARSGNRVYATMRNLAKDGPLKEAAAAENLDVRITQLDVDSQTSIDEAVRGVVAAEGQIDVLVNNAGITGVGSIEESTDAEFHAVMETNFFGPLRVVRAVLPGMRERESGAIINVSSVAGRLAVGTMGQYHSSKYALECATETLAMEVKQFGIRVALIEPGFFVTPILDKANEAQNEFGDSPYAELGHRVRALYQQAAAEGGPPSVVAQVIEDAVTTTDPKLRYLVGDDAVPFVHGRMKLTDEEVLTLGDKQTDDEWFAKFMEMFPMPAEV